MAVTVDSKQINISGVKLAQIDFYTTLVIQTSNGLEIKASTLTDNLQQSRILGTLYDILLDSAAGIRSMELAPVFKALDNVSFTSVSNELYSDKAQEGYSVYTVTIIETTPFYPNGTAFTWTKDNGAGVKEFYGVNRTNLRYKAVPKRGSNYTIIEVKIDSGCSYIPTLKFIVPDAFTDGMSVKEISKEYRELVEKAINDMTSNLGIQAPIDLNKVAYVIRSQVRHIVDYSVTVSSQRGVRL